VRQKYEDKFRLLSVRHIADIFFETMTYSVDWKLESTGNWIKTEKAPGAISVSVSIPETNN